MKLEPVEVDGKTWYRAVCHTPGCTLGVDGGVWATRPCAVKAPSQWLARLHREDHRHPDRAPISTSSAAKLDLSEENGQ